ncbi:hypothetical protein BDU57DRAFT_548325 [Ampelomyces quisqualis]|uniref:Uncharacterized protein n=1 Tax=Ampelomyces quisqualis TaxID=50730 RepID=A0A6A5QP70_AMPQU|nr:hypothetical protein BDU57DRAFT_548325 [Ampelomyces quisqualis]
MALPRRYTLRSIPKTFQQPEKPNGYGANPTLGFLDHFDGDDTLYNGEGLLVSSDEPFSPHDKWRERRAFGHALEPDSDNSELVAFEPEIHAHEYQELLDFQGNLFRCRAMLYYTTSIILLSLRFPDCKYTALYLWGLWVMDRVWISVYTYLFATPLEKRLARKRKAREYTKKIAPHRTPDRVSAPRGRKFHRNLHDNEDHLNWQSCRFWQESLEEEFPHWRVDIKILVKLLLVVVRDLIIFQLVFQLFATTVQTLGVHFYHGEDVVGIFPRYWNNIKSIQSLFVQPLQAFRYVTMKFILAITFLLPLTIAHSWLGCTDHDNSEILNWMKTNATAFGKDHVIDPLMPWFAHLCHAWPRAKQNPGDWIDESSNYLWALTPDSPETETGKFACHPDQRTPTYFASSTSPSANHVFHSAPAPMATSSPGQSLKLLFGGNGHSRGANAGENGDPGRVGVYWAGLKETELIHLSDLNSSTLVQENGFSEESFSFPADMNVKSPEEGLVDKGNWMTLRL